MRGPSFPHRWPGAGPLPLALLALALCLCTACDRLPGASALRLTYVVTIPEVAGNGAIVEVRVDGPPPRGFRMLLPPRGNRRELRALAPDSTTGGDPKGPHVLRYTVRAPEAPHGGRSFACYRGFELLAQPAGVLSPDADSVVLEFRIPEHLSVVAPLSLLAADPQAPARGAFAISEREFDTLLESYLAIGDYAVRVLPPVPRRLPAVVWGRRGLGEASEGELIDVVERLLLAHSEHLGPDRPKEPYSVVVDYPYSGHGFAGNATGRSIDLRLSRDLGVADSPGLVRLTSHELAHFWLGGAYPFPKPEDHWFVEGAADYCGLRARVQAGFVDPADAGDELAAQWFDLSSNPWLHRPMEDLGRSFMLEPEAFTASYARGCLTVWALEWRAAQAGRPGIAAVLDENARTREHASMRSLLSTHLKSATPGPDNPAADVGALLGPEPEPAFTRILADAGLRYHAVPTRDLTFGLERFEPGTTRLVAVPAGSPAEGAGVKPGDAIRAVDGYPVFDTIQLQEAMERSFSRPAYKLEGMVVEYERAGLTERVRLFAAPQVEARWLDDKGERATRIFP
ncbi:MAG: PDZ domain-containing protein [Candidatus Eiseniibacteriota bacterium]